MRNLTFIVLILLFSSSFILSINKSKMKSKYNIPSPKVYVIDNFEDGQLLTNPKWWLFGNINAYKRYQVF